MAEEQARDERKHCPNCGRRSSSVVDSIFVEYGEWNGDAYDAEGDAQVYRCADVFCGFAFADVTGIPVTNPDEKPEWVSVHTLASNPAPKPTEQGI
jgi:hypothetical protein